MTYNPDEARLNTIRGVGLSAVRLILCFVALFALYGDIIDARVAAECVSALAAFVLTDLLYPERR